MIFKVLVFTFFAFLFGTIDAYELGIISMFRDCAPYLKEWVEYHHMVGVDHFWLYNDESRDNWEAVLKPYIKNGLVEVIYWKSRVGNDKAQSSSCSWWAGHRRACRDGIEKAQKTDIKWVAIIDLDEFLLPMQEKTVTECLQKHFSAATAVYASWRIFGTSNVFLEKGEPLLLSLTSCTLRSHPENVVGKSIVRPHYVIVDKIDTVHDYPLTAGSTYFDGNGNMMNLISDRIDREHRQCCDGYIRINHYKYRDENYFRIRAQRDRLNNKKINLQRKIGNLDKDYKMVNLIKEMHPDMYEKYWKQFKHKASTLNVDLRTENQRNVSKQDIPFFNQNFDKWNDDSFEVKPSAATASPKEFVIVIASYNNKDWYQWNLGSIVQQKYKNYRVIYIDDASTDGTADLVEKFIKDNKLEDKIFLIRNKKRFGILFNQYYAIHSCSDNQIAVMVDGDDWLAHENVLNVLNDVYQDINIWLTYGQFIRYPKGDKGCSKPFSDYEISNNLFRNVSWRSSALRTYYVWLFKKIKIKDLMHNGKFFPNAVDAAVMFPMLEMAGHRIKCIPNILYIYNRANLLNCNKVMNMSVAKLYPKMIRDSRKYNCLPEIKSNINMCF